MMIQCPHCNKYIVMVIKKPMTPEGYYHPNPEWPIRKLGLSTRATNALINDGYDTIGKVLDTLINSPYMLERTVPNFGRRCFGEVKLALAAGYVAE